MDYHYDYAKAVMKELLEEARVQRLVAEVRRSKSRDIPERRWSRVSSFLPRRANPDRACPVESSLEPACCAS